MYRENLHRQQFYHKYIFRLEEGICFLSFNLKNHRFLCLQKALGKKNDIFFKTDNIYMYQCINVIGFKYISALSN